MPSKNTDWILNSEDPCWLDCFSQCFPKPITGSSKTWFEPHYEETGLRGFRPGQTQTRLYSHTRWLEAWIVFRKKRDCTIYVAKTKALISFAVTTKLICVFVFAYAKIRFSHDKAHFIMVDLHDNFTYNYILLKVFPQKDRWQSLWLRWANISSDQIH